MMINLNNFPLFSYILIHTIYFKCILIMYISIQEKPSQATKKREIHTPTKFHLDILRKQQKIMRNYLAPSSKTEITPTTSTTITTIGISRLLPQTISMEASNSTYSSNSAPITTSNQTSTSNSSSTKHR